MYFKVQTHSRVDNNVPVYNTLCLIMD